MSRSQPIPMQQDARTGTRTRTPLRERDFKSLASTRFAIPATKYKGESRSRWSRGRAAFSRAATLQPSPALIRAGNGTRTRDPNLGKVVLYQLSYSRASRNISNSTAPTGALRLALRSLRTTSPYGRSPSAFDRVPRRPREHPDNDASPPFPTARPSASTTSAAMPPSSGARRSHCSTARRVRTHQPRALLHERAAA